jgi:hypothetical protein
MAPPDGTPRRSRLVRPSASPDLQATPTKAPVLGQRKLGRYVVIKRRRDGTERVYFQVPARLRPVGWFPAIRLPLGGGQRFVSQAELVAIIRADAAGLYARLNRLMLQQRRAEWQRELATDNPHSRKAV